MDLFWAQRSGRTSEGTTSALKLIFNRSCPVSRGAQLLLKQPPHVAPQAWETEMACSLYGRPSRENIKYKTISEEAPQLLLSTVFFLDRNLLLSSFHYLFLVQLFLLWDICLHRWTFHQKTGKTRKNYRDGQAGPSVIISECLIHYFRCLILQT